MTRSRWQKIAKFYLPIVLVLIEIAWLNAAVRGNPLWVSEPPHLLDFARLRVTEIMFEPSAGDSDSGGTYEFIELQNQGATVLDLSGYLFSDGIALTLSAGTQLNPGAFLVIAKDPAAFLERYGRSPDNPTGYSGQLNNGGESIELRNTSGTNRLSVAYQTDAAHLQLANGSGFSIVPIDPATTPTTAEEWRISSEANGSPGAEDIPATQGASASIKINEVLAHTDPPQVDFVELYNPTNEAVDIGGWYITDSLNEPTRFQIPFGTQVPAAGYLVFNQEQLGFAFFSEGDSAYIVAADAAGNLTGYSHGFDFGVTPNGVSVGRCIDGTDVNNIVEHFTLQEQVTEGGSNSRPHISPIVISELHYAPESDDEFIELVNLTTDDVPLYDPEHPENLWQINGIGAFTLTMNSILPANGTILLTSIEPSLFRSRYNIPAAVQIQGPFSGQLSDNGEKVTLKQPDAPNTDGTVPFIVLDMVDYKATSPWPDALQSGQSLERIVLDEFGNSPANWRLSEATGGTPGEVTGVTLGDNTTPFVKGFDLLFLPFVASRTSDTAAPSNSCL